METTSRITERQANQALSNWAESEAYERAQWERVLGRANGAKVLAAPRSNAVSKPVQSKGFFSFLFGG